jgi:hypothetical protein
MEERDFEAVLGEFLPDEEEMERQIREEMDRLYDEQGAGIRVKGRAG